jgi:hypothetical protein
MLLAMHLAGISSVEHIPEEVRSLDDSERAAFGRRIAARIVERVFPEFPSEKVCIWPNEAMHGLMEVTQ